MRALIAPLTSIRHLSVLVPLIAAAPAWSQARLSEIRIDQTNSDTDEYFELFGPPGQELAGLSYVVIGDGTAGSGVIEEAVPLAGYSIPADGYFLAAEASFGLGVIPDLTTDLNFENSDNVTHLLTAGFSGSVGDDLDVDDDGALDTVPWLSVEDCVAVLQAEGSGDRTYCAVFAGPNGSVAPTHVFLDGTWQIGSSDPSDGLDTPGGPNVTLPVELSGFQVIAVGSTVTFTWSTLSETGNDHFIIEEILNGAVEFRGRVPGSGTSNQRRVYSHYTLDVPPGRHKYVLSQVDVDGERRTIASGTVEILPGPSSAVSAPYPNPFRTEAVIDITAVQSQTIVAHLYDVLGARRARLFSGRAEAGRKLRVAIGGAGLAPGVYVVRVRGEYFEAARTVVRAL